MRRVIIMGASSGIGKKMALHYATAGCQVGIAARREERLKQIALQHPDQIVYRVADVSIPGEGGAEAGFEYLLEKLGGADLVVYCAGAGEQNTLLDIDKEIKAVQVNALGLVCVAIPFFRYLMNRKEDNGFTPQFVVISSLASVKGLGVAASYSASKRFQVTYLEGLAQLAVKKGLKVSFSTILPGFIRTDFIGNRNFPMTMSLDYAVKRIIGAVERRKVKKVVDWRWALVAFFWSLIPGCVWRRIKL